MKSLSFIGAGYVGLCNAVGFASLGFDVKVVDVDAEKVRMINSGVPPIYEKGLKELLSKVLEGGSFEATADLKYAVDGSEVSFICVQTPSRKDGSIELKYVKEAAKDLGRCIRGKGWHLVVVKSTVVPSATEDVVIPVLERFSGKHVGVGFGVCMCPEFLSEGDAFRGFFSPDRIVIGEYDKRSGDVLEGVFSVFDSGIPRLRVDLRTAEMIKYASNAFIGVKISFANEIGNICKNLGIDGRTVMEGVALDHRFSKFFMKPGMSFGGPCLEKDISALAAEARKRGLDPRILSGIIGVNRRQTEILLDIVRRKIRDGNLRRVGILGLSYKADVSDVRRSQAIEIISALKGVDVEVFAYDPEAEEGMSRLCPGINYKDTGQEVVDDSDVVLVLTDWEEFGDLDFRGKIVVDGRGIIPKEKCEEYEGICW